MRLAFFGSGEFGLATLEELLARGNQVAAVVSKPDRPAGRGGDIRSTPISALAREWGLPVLTPEKPNSPEFVAEVESLHLDLAVIVAYGHLIKKELLAAPRLGFINLHASLLPAYRGAAPVPWAILSGESTSGASVFQLDERFDTGSLLGEVQLSILDDDTAGSYLARLAPFGGKLTADVVADIEKGRAVAQPQDNARASLAPKLKKEDGLVIWELDRRRIDCMVRAFQPWPQAYSMFNTPKGKLRISILSVQNDDAPADGCKPGDIVAADPKRGLIVMTADGPIRLCELQPEGKRRMADKEFLRGVKLL